MMPSIFISYRQSDSAGYAGRIFDRLRYWFGEDELFFDVDSLETGTDFPEEIDLAIQAVSAVLVVIGPQWFDMLNQRVLEPKVDRVRQEVAIAIQRRIAGEVVVLPILVGGAEMPACNDLHPELRNEIGKLFDYQGHIFHGNQADWDNQFERLRSRLAKVDGVPAPCAQASFIESSINRSSQGILPTRMPISLDTRSVEQTFGAVSQGMLNWPQETDGQWIERPELDQLYDLTTRDKSAVTVLLGRPGEGKSAIFARLGMKLSGEDAVLLAIKADQLPRNIATPDDLDDWIGCEIPLTEALRELSKERRVVVLIDQLDALADLIDQHSERLSVLLRFVNILEGVPNLHVLMSCREFEYHNDVRLSTLKAEKVSLARLSWKQVEPLPVARGIETNGWSEDVRDVLRTPQHLAMFLGHLADKENEPLFTNYQGLLARIVSERLEKIYGGRTVEAAEHIAKVMALEEEIWLGRNRFEQKFGTEMQHLERAGFLMSSDNGLSVAFRHQTLFDFLRARSFLRDGQPLAEYIVEKKQESLFVRPILWSALSYLQASDKAVYREQFYQLWTRNELRPHLRYLLIDFLGQVTAPDEQEVQWLISKLEDPALRSRILRAITGNLAWFARMGSRLPSLMLVQPEEAREIAFVLGKAAAFEPGKVLRLVNQFWIADERYLTCALTALRDFTQWDESSVEIAARLAEHAPNDRFSIQHLAEEISKSRPDLAPKVIARYLRARTDKLAAPPAPSADRSVPGASNEEQIAETPRNINALRPYEHLIENSSDWYNIERLAMKAPRAFVEEIWPWLTELFERLASDQNPFLNQYRNHHGLAFKRETDDKQSLQNAIAVAIRGFAEADIEAFLDFVQANQNTELNVLHRLLALGLERIALKRPTAVLEYLLGDSRRFAIGDMNNIHRDSQALISAVVPVLKDDEALFLEKAIIAWSLIRDVPWDEDAVSRLERSKWTRKHRLRLLRKFPFDRLSPSGQQHLREEERALPGTPTQDRRDTEPQWIGSPMSAEQMQKATDDQIFALFEELTDDTGWDHPMRQWPDPVGGSIQASREFAKFANSAPNRALNLIRRFKAGKMENPTGEAFAEMAKGTTPPETLIASIHELDERGFTSELFRANAARCLRELALRAGGLDDKTCSLLETWIMDWSPETTGQSRDDGTEYLGVSATSDEHEENCESLLWDHGSDRLVPQGNYPYLDALMHGYLCRNPHDVDGWLSILERHLPRSENPVVWYEIVVDLWHLDEADRNHAIRFLESLFRSYPEVLCSATGVSLIGRIQSWLPKQKLKGIINGWISGRWEKGPQAAGEIMTLKLCRNPDHPETRKRVEGFIIGDDYDPSVVDKLRLGVAHTLVVAWSEPALRALTTPLLIRLLSMGSVSVENALSAIFRKTDPLPADDHTRKFLEALLERPTILARGEYFLTDRLKGLLREGWHPTLVHKVANTLIRKRKEGQAIGDIHSASVAGVGDLADLALTLHRIPETRESGLGLFEQLMDMNSYELDERLTMIDRLAFQ